MSDEQKIVLELERQRIDAIAEGNIEALQSMLADDYVHVHMSGRVDDRDSYIRGAIAKPRVLVINPANVRIYGELAVITGDLAILTADRNPIEAYCHRVAVRRLGRWQFVSVHLTHRTIA